MLYKTITLAAAALSLMTAAPALAHDFSDTVKAQAEVSFSDLDLSTKPDAATMLARIQSAAKRLCRPALSSEYGGFRAYRNCFAETVDNTVDALNEPLVTALHENNQTLIAKSN